MKKVDGRAKRKVARVPASDPDRALLNTYEAVALRVLVEEFDFHDPQQTDVVIRRRLARRKLGAFDASRVGALRALKDDVQREIALQHLSAYYVAPQKGRLTRYVDMSDFDLPRLIRDLAARHPGVPLEHVELFVPYAVALYHLL